MAAWVCVGCTTVYAVGAPRCPHCGSSEYVEQGAEMPKITRHEGASVFGASVVGGSWSDTDAPDAWPAGEEAAAEGGEDVSAGTDSSTSAETRGSEPEPGSKPARSPARTTGSRSSKARTGKGSSVRTTDGGQTEATSETGSAKAAE